MSKEFVNLKVSFLKKFMKDVFIGLTVPPRDAEICADVLAAADLMGMDSHGISRMKPIYYDRIKQGIQFPKTKFEIVKETPTTAVIDGNHGMGHVIAYKAMDIAIKKAEKYGLGMTAVRNSTHYGIAGYYSLMAVKKGMIGLTGTNARPSIAPTFGVENMLGTNPQTWGIPTDEKFPFLLDCATSVTQRGKIEVYAKLNKKMPEGWVVNRSGKSETDPKKVLKMLTEDSAALLPLGGLGEETGGYKGYGYATVIEILSAALQDGSYLKQLNGKKDGKPAPYRLGHFFMAIDISHFTSLNKFKKTAGNILRQLRASQKAKGCKRIYTAGEKEYLTSVERIKKGVPVNAQTRLEMIKMRDELNLKYKFDFE
ncbi:MAG: Ldh family oxidoreductase [Elusimicrobiota bacterium]